MNLGKTSMLCCLQHDPSGNDAPFYCMYDPTVDPKFGGSLVDRLGDWEIGGP
jgi:hypothetical protein